MTIKEFTLMQKKQSINEWIDLIKESGYESFESEIIACADQYELIEESNMTWNELFSLSINLNL
jgi:hypothetical protein